MPTLSRTAVIDAPAERVFTYIDDIRSLARHMSESRSTGVGATYRYYGRMMGLVIDFSEMVTKYVAGREKIWRTIGQPRLLIIRHYEMRVLVEPVSPTETRLTIGIDYELPRSGVWRAIGWALAGTYSRWCLTSMVRGTKLDLERTGSTPRAQA
jgi:hypothetical protein